MATDNTKTVANILTEVRELADIVALTDRHSDALLIRMLNNVVREFRTRLSNAGFSYFLEATTAAALPTSAAVSGEQYLEIDFPTGAVSVHGVDVKFGSDWIPIRQGSFAERRDYQSLASGGQLNPYAPHTFVVRTVPVESTTTVTAGKIMLFPLETSGRNYRVWYLPVWADIAAANTSYVIYGHDMWFSWIELEMCIRIYMRDNDSQGALSAAIQMRADTWDQVVKATRNMQSAGPVQARPRRRNRRRW